MIGDGASTIGEIRDYAIGSAEGMGLLSEGLRTTTGEVAALTNSWTDFKANTGAGVLTIVEPFLASSNAAHDMNDAMQRAREELKGIGLSAREAESALGVINRGGKTTAEVMAENPRAVFVIRARQCISPARERSALLGLLMF